MQQSASLAFESMEALTSKESAFSTLVGEQSLTSHGTHIREAPGQTKGKSPKAMLLQEWMLSLPILITSGIWRSILLSVMTEGCEREEYKTITITLIQDIESLRLRKVFIQ